MKYIDAEKLIALIDAKLEDLGMSGSVWVGRSVLQELKNDITTSLQQEQSEVDLENEISNFIDTYYKDAKIGYKLSIRRIAMHFFQLGLKAKQG